MFFLWIFGNFKLTQDIWRHICLMLKKRRWFPIILPLASWLPLIIMVYYIMIDVHNFSFSWTNLVASIYKLLWGSVLSIELFHLISTKIPWTTCCSYPPFAEFSLEHSWGSITCHDCTARATVKPEFKPTESWFQSLCSLPLVNAT